jgi:hypothetical protein
VWRAAKSVVVMALLAGSGCGGSEKNLTTDQRCLREYGRADRAIQTAMKPAEYVEFCKARQPEGVRRILMRTTTTGSVPTSATSSFPTPTPPRPSLVVTLTLSVNRSDAGVVLSGNTNLPEGTELMLSVADEAYFTSDPNAPNFTDYMAQDKAVVLSGSFDSKTFDRRGAPLPPGRYLATATMPIPLESACTRSGRDRQGRRESAGAAGKERRHGPHRRGQAVFFGLVQDPESMTS